MTVSRSRSRSADKSPSKSRSRRRDSSKSRSPDTPRSRSRSKRRDSSRSRSPATPPSKSRSKRADRSRSRSPVSSSKARSRKHGRSRSRSPRSPVSKPLSRKNYRKSRSISPKRAKKSRTPPPANPPKAAEPKKEGMDLLRTRAGGAYIPPAKLKLLQEQISDKSGEQYQRMNWERLKKKIHGLVNKVNTGNMVYIVRELLQENVIRGKGLLTRSIIQAQAFSPVFSNVYAALVSIINSKFPHIGELVLRRLIVQFKRSFRRNDKGTTVTVVKFIAHLINQMVAHEVLALEIIILMLETPTDDSVEVSIAFLKECGAKLMQSAPAALRTVFDRLRAILTESAQGTLDKRIQYMIEVAMTIRKENFKAYPSVIDELDLIDEDDQITHTITLEDAVDPENQLNVFKLDTEFEKNEATYDEIRKEIIGDADSSDEEGGGDEDDDDDEDNEGGTAVAEAKGTTEIIDNTEQNMVAFRREIYLTVQSSLDFQEAAHKILKMKIKPELEAELCHMLVDCCAQSRTYERFYGLLCERFCRLRKEYQDTFEQIARDTYSTIHRFEITKLRNMARLISHLLFTDAISWMILSDIKLTEEDTTSSGRIFIKFVFQELSESMGLAKLYERIKDPTLQDAFAGLFPRDNPANARFAINFFTLIGLGGLTIDLREFLEKGMKKRAEDMKLEEEEDTSDSSSSDSSDSDDSDSDSDSSSSSSSSSSDSEDERKKSAKHKERKKKESKRSKHSEREKTDVVREVKEEPLSPTPIDRENKNRDRLRSPDDRRAHGDERREGRKYDRIERTRDQDYDRRDEDRRGRGDDRRDNRDEEKRDRGDNRDEEKRDRGDDRPDNRDEERRDLGDDRRDNRDEERRVKHRGRRDDDRVERKTEHREKDRKQRDRSREKEDRRRDKRVSPSRR